MSVEAARAALERVADFGPPESKDWPLVNATIAVAEATLALHDVIREALADEAPEQHVEPPAPMEPASLWTPITHDTVCTGRACPHRVDGFVLRHGAEGQVDSRPARRHPVG
jgi:hypothetical protein